MTAKNPPTLTVPIALKKVSFGKGAASVGGSIPRADLGLDDAAKYLIRSRIEVNLELDPSAQRQQILEGLAPSVRGAADISSISVDSDTINCTLSFKGKALGDEQMTSLRKLAQAKCVMKFVRTGDAVKEAADTGGDDGEGHHADGPAMFDGEDEPDDEDDDEAASTSKPPAPAPAPTYRDRQISELLHDDAVVDQLRSRGCHTLGNFEDFDAKDTKWSDHGIDPGAVTALRRAVTLARKGDAKKAA